jgi:hypothetical protein
MKRSILFGAVVSLVLLFTPVVHAQYTQAPPSSELMQGTQMRLVLLNGLSTSVARDGDPFEAVVSDPVYFGGQLVLPAGAKVRGTVSNIITPRHFGLFRQQAAMTLVFQSIQVDSREYPVKLSILGIYRDSTAGSKMRKDVNTQEGELVQQKRDIKGGLTDMAIGTAGGVGVGAIFSHVVRGTIFGIVGSAAYVAQKKGKDVELPAQTAFLVRLDSPVSVPGATRTATGINGAGGQ